MSFSFPPATKFAPNSRNDAFSSRRNAASIPDGKSGSPGRSRTIYLNFAFIVALRDYLYHTRRYGTPPARISRGAVKSTTIPEVPIAPRTRTAEVPERSARFRVGERYTRLTKRLFITARKRYRRGG